MGDGPAIQARCSLEIPMSHADSHKHQDLKHRGAAPLSTPTVLKPAARRDIAAAMYRASGH